MRRSRLLLATLAVIWWPSSVLAVSDESIRVCGDDYYMTFLAPKGWEDNWAPNDLGLGMSFVPPGEPEDAPRLLLAVDLTRSGYGSGVDLDVALERRVAALTIGSPRSRIRNAALAHPTLESRSATISLPDSRVHYVLMDPKSPEGYLVGAALAIRADEAGRRGLDALAQTLASIDFDVTKVCKPGPNDTTVVKPRKQHPADLADPSPEAEPRLSSGQRAARRALVGCQMLAQLFVPVRCLPGRLEGAPTFLAIFERDEARTAEENLETFHGRLAATYCWASAGQRLPQLAVTAMERDSDPTLGTVRVFSCETGGWVRDHPIDRFELDPAVYEEL